MPRSLVYWNVEEKNGSKIGMVREPGVRSVGTRSWIPRDILLSTPSYIKYLIPDKPIEVVGTLLYL